MVADLISRGRKYGLAVVWATQEAKSMAESPFGFRMLTNAARKVLLAQGQDNAALALLTELFELGPGEQEWLRATEPGRALLLAGDERRAVRVEASPEELAALTTDPAELAAREARRLQPPQNRQGLAG